MHNVVQARKYADERDVYLRVSIYERQGDGGVTHSEMLFPISMAERILGGVARVATTRLREIGVDAPDTLKEGEAQE